MKAKEVIKALTNEQVKRMFNYQPPIEPVYFMGKETMKLFDEAILEEAEKRNSKYGRTK